MDAWARELGAAITVCDREGRILDMNDRSANTFEKDGGRELVGQNVLDCHPEPARTKLEGMLASGKSNCYTIEKKGAHKLIFQAPWFEKGEYRGFVELSFEIPEKMAHFVRK
jgi:transcriptional regulator with PAS, ATPase and Fis domain